MLKEYNENIHDSLNSMNIDISRDSFLGWVGMWC